MGQPFKKARSKAVDRDMVMGDIKLLEESSGKSGEWKAGVDPILRQKIIYSV